jgi:hypothetical protein
MLSMTISVFDDDSWVGRTYRMLYTNTPEYFWIFVIMMSLLFGPLLWLYQFYQYIRFR